MFLSFCSTVGSERLHCFFPLCPKSRFHHAASPSLALFHSHHSHGPVRPGMFSLSLSSPLSSPHTVVSSTRWLLFLRKRKRTCVIRNGKLGVMTQVTETESGAPGARGPVSLHFRKKIYLVFIRLVRSRQREYTAELIPPLPRPPPPPTPLLSCDSLFIAHSRALYTDWPFCLSRLVFSYVVTTPSSGAFPQSCCCRLFTKSCPGLSQA